MIAIITLERMKFYAFHGVMEEERIIGGTFLVDISYVINTDSVESDRLVDSVNYADIFDLTKKEMMQPSQLIEHVAGRIQQAIRDEFPQICELVVKVSKLNPPVNGEIESASVTLSMKK